MRLFDTAKGEVVPFEPASRVGCRCTCAVPPSTGRRTSGTGASRWCSTCCAGTSLWRGNDVAYVSNITDIDDKIIARAAEQGVDPAAFALEQEAVWWEVMDGIGVMRPTHDPHATAYVPADGGAHRASRRRRVPPTRRPTASTSVPRRSPTTACWRGSRIDSLRAGARVEANEEKRSPIDFALWKKAKPGEPSWPSPWGDGRPGWHTECVVMSLDLLGEGFDLHGGGQDLSFPHHENERAQAVADGKRFAAHWVHNGFVEVEGEKMSKSLGNFTNLSDLIEPVRPARLPAAGAAGPLPVADRGERGARPPTPPPRSPASTPSPAPAAKLPVALPDDKVLASFVAAMDDDLDTPAAMALLFDTVRRVNTAVDDGRLDEAAAPGRRRPGDRPGRGPRSCTREAGEIPDDIAALAPRRDEARAAKDWARADAVRDELQAAGYVVEDTPSGTEVRPA